MNSEKVNELLKKCKELIDIQEFEEAYNISNDIINLDPKCALGYFYQFLCEQNISDEADLALVYMPLNEFETYKKAMEYAEGDLKDKLEKYNRLVYKRLANEKKEEYYNEAIEAMDNGDYEEALTYLNKIKGYKDADELIEECNSYICEDSLDDESINDEEVVSFSNPVYTVNKPKKSKKDKIITIIFVSIFIVVFSVVLYMANFSPSARYDEALKLSSEGKYDEAYNIFKDLDDYRDSNVQIELLNAKKAFDKGSYEEGMEYVINANGVVIIDYNTNLGSTILDDIITSLPYKEKNSYREGYEFIGWVLSDYSVGLNEHVAHLYLDAVWVKENYKISYDLDGGTCNYIPDYYTIDDEISIPNPTKEFHNFIGWTVKDTDIPKKNYKIKEGTTGNISLNAVFERIYNHKYIVNHFIWDKEINDYKCDQQILDTTIGITEYPKPYEIEGYITPEVEAVKIIDDVITVNYYYDIIETDLTFISNGGNAINDVTVKYGDSLGDEYIPVREGYTFGGWFSDINLTIPYEGKSEEEELTLYAYWQEETKPSSFGYKMNSEGYEITYVDEDLRKAVIPEYIGGIRVTRINQKAFNDCMYVREVVIPISVTYVEDGAFRGCNNLQSITLPMIKKDGNNYIDCSIIDLFETGDNMGLIYIPDTLTEVIVTGENGVSSNAFFYCTELESVKITKGSTIGSMAFSGCNNLKSVYISKNVTEIGGQAFLVSSSITLYYEGTEAEWNAISFGSDCFMPGKYNVVFNSSLNS